jgi:hypothetical protein
MDYNEWKFQQLKNNTEQSYEKSTTASNIGFFVVAFFLWSAILFIENWLLMIFIGSLHSVFNSIPAPSFWTVLWFNILLGIVFNIIRQNIKASK